MFVVPAVTPWRKEKQLSVKAMIHPPTHRHTLLSSLCSINTALLRPLLLWKHPIIHAVLLHSLQLPFLPNMNMHGLDPGCSVWWGVLLFPRDDSVTLRWMCGGRCSFMLPVLSVCAEIFNILKLHNLTTDIRCCGFCQTVFCLGTETKPLRQSV